MSFAAYASDWRTLAPGPLQVDYAQTGLHKLIGSKAKITDILQSYYNQVYGIGFLHIGHMADSGHGHFLKDESGEIFAILYHTREVPDRLSDEDKEIIKVENRNWLQSTNSPYFVENAFPLIFESTEDYPGLPEEISRGDSHLESWMNFMTYSTVHSTMLDPNKVGKNFNEDYDNGFRFIRVRCSELDSASNVIALNAHDSSEICLTVHINIDSDQRDYVYQSRGPLLSTLSISD